MPDRNSERIRELNDELRKTSRGGKIVLTKGVAVMSEFAIARIMSEVQLFTDFNQENDPHGEHDMAFFPLNDKRFYFKIDYFSTTMEHGSPDPSDPAQTIRILTIGLAEDY